MGKTKELAAKQQQEEQFRDSPLGKAITELESHVEGHLIGMFEAAGVTVSPTMKEAMMTNFIGASHAAGTIQRLVWEQMDFQAKQTAEVATAKPEKAERKAAKKEAVKANRPRGKMTVKK